MTISTPNSSAYPLTTPLGPVQRGVQILLCDQTCPAGQVMKQPDQCGGAPLREGITIAFRADAGLAVAGFAVALAFVRGPRASPAHAAAPAAHHRAQAGPRRGRPARDRRDIVTM